MYTQKRTDFLEFVPAGCRRILSVGCATGVSEADLIKQGIQVIGIESDPEAAKTARSNGLEVLNETAETARLEQYSSPFDYLLYPDVLEHLVDPAAVLQAHVRYLKTGGRVFVCIPNFRHYSVFKSLFLYGYIPYEKYGLFDQTHIRITTRKLVLQWFRLAGLRPIAVKYRMKRTREKIFSCLSLGLLKDFFAGQIILVGEKQ